MIKNYLKIAFRNLWRHKVFSFINIMGLAVALTACFPVFGGYGVLPKVSEHYGGNFTLWASPQLLLFYPQPVSRLLTPPLLTPDEPSASRFESEIRSQGDIF